MKSEKKKIIDKHKTKKKFTEKENTQGKLLKLKSSRAMEIK